MLRLLIGTGALLMVVGFGAAGWQVWQGRTDATPDEVAEENPGGLQQAWLVSPSGGVVPREDVGAYLVQERFVPGRTVTITTTAPLTDLLSDGETLPETPYLEVLADIRAPKAADGLCKVLVARVAQDCAILSARVVPDSVDALRGTAAFRIELVYRLRPEAADLPDLAANVLQTEWLSLDLDPSAAEAPTAEAALAAIVDAASVACGGKAAAQTCRIMRLALEWPAGSGPNAKALIGWLDPLPVGMFPAPPLDPAPKG